MLTSTTIPISLLLVAALSAPALGSFGGGSPKPEPPQQPTVPGSGTQGGASTPRMEAEQSYALAYEEVAKAKKDLAEGKTKNAEKKFKKALERGEKAVALAEDYHEAWNLVGYCARQTGKLDRSFEAYEKCLSLKGDYAPAREYLGEAWLERGDVNSRVWVRIREVEESLSLIERIVETMPEGPIAVALALGPGEGVALVEGFRGDIFVWLRLGAEGRIARCHLRDPSWFQWPLLEAAVEGNIVADFPLVNKSFNCSYSGHDL